MNFNIPNIDFLTECHLKECMIHLATNPKKFEGLVIFDNRIAKMFDLWHP